MNFTHFGNIMPEELFTFTIEFSQIKKYHIYKLGRNQYTIRLLRCNAATIISMLLSFSIFVLKDIHIFKMVKKKLH